MRILGIPDDDLVRLNSNYRPGKGEEVAYRHIPSGITVFRRCLPTKSTIKVDKELLAALQEKLRSAGLIAGVDEPS